MTSIREMKDGVSGGGGNSAPVANENYIELLDLNIPTEVVDAHIMELDLDLNEEPTKEVEVQQVHEDEVQQTEDFADQLEEAQLSFRDSGGPSNYASSSEISNNSLLVESASRPPSEFWMSDDKQLED
jgi:hypothetical protein